MSRRSQSRKRQLYGRDSEGIAALVGPKNIVLPLLTGAGTVGATETCSQGTWSGNPTPTYTYQWKKDGVSIGGATASTYVLAVGDATHVINCVVTATNLYGVLALASSNSVTVP